MQGEVPVCVYCPRVGAMWDPRVHWEPVCQSSLWLALVSSEQLVL